MPWLWLLTLISTNSLFIINIHLFCIVLLLLLPLPPIKALVKPTSQTDLTVPATKLRFDQHLAQGQMAKGRAGTESHVGSKSPALALSVHRVCCRCVFCTLGPQVLCMLWSSVFRCRAHHKLLCLKPHHRRHLSTHSAQVASPSSLKSKRALFPVTKELHSPPE